MINSLDNPFCVIVPLCRESAIHLTLNSKGLLYVSLIVLMWIWKITSNHSGYDKWIWFSSIHMALLQSMMQVCTLLFCMASQNIWVRSRNCGCLVTWFWYQLIAKPGNKIATVFVTWPISRYVTRYLMLNDIKCVVIGCALHDIWLDYSNLNYVECMDIMDSRSCIELNRWCMAVDENCFIDQDFNFNFNYFLINTNWFTNNGFSSTITSRGLFY